MPTESKVRGLPGDLVLVPITLRGAGAAAPVVELGPKGRPLAAASATSGASGVTTTRAAAGDYTLTLSERPGIFLGMVAGRGADAPAAATARTVSFENDTAFVGAADTTAGRQIRIFVTDVATPAAAELAATDVVCLLLVFAAYESRPA